MKVPNRRARRAVVEFEAKRQDGTVATVTKGMTVFVAADEPGDELRFTIEDYGWYAAGRAILMHATEPIHG